MMLEYAYILTYFCAYKSGGVGRVRTSVCVIQQKEIGNFCNYFAGWEKLSMPRVETRAYNIFPVPREDSVQWYFF